MFWTQIRILFLIEVPSPFQTVLTEERIKVSCWSIWRSNTTKKYLSCCLAEGKSKSHYPLLLQKSCKPLPNSCHHVDSSGFARWGSPRFGLPSLICTVELHNRVNLWMKPPWWGEQEWMYAFRGVDTHTLLFFPPSVELERKIFSCSKLVVVFRQDYCLKQLFVVFGQDYQKS